MSAVRRAASPQDATAFPQRNSHFVMNVHARWREPAMDKACIDWARGLFEAAKPYAAGTAYVNFMPEDEVDRVEAAYGGNYRRLAGDQAALRPAEPVPHEPELAAEAEPARRLRCVTRAGALDINCPHGILALGGILSLCLPNERR